MKFSAAIVASGLLAVLLIGCSHEQTKPASPVNSREAHALPDSAFKAQITLIEPPAKLRVGQKEIVRLNVKNASAEQWYSHGGEVNSNPDNRFYLAVGDRWMKADGTTLVTDMDGRRGLQKDLKPGQDEEVPLQITAPKDPGDYVLEVDLVQEQVTWFSAKGSPVAKTRITVTR